MLYRKQPCFFICPILFEIEKIYSIISSNTLIFLFFGAYRQRNRPNGNEWS